MTNSLIAVLIALLSALCFAAASATQQSVASTVSHEAEDGYALIRSLITQPRWWMGVLGDGGGYVLQAVALSYGSLLLVSPLLVTSLLFALPISAVIKGDRVQRRTLLLAVSLSVALALFLFVGHPKEGPHDAAMGQWLKALIPLGIVIALCVFSARFFQGSKRSLLMGATSGVVFGITAPLTKSVLAIGSEGIGHIFSSWQLWLLIVCGLGGFYFQQRAFQLGSIEASMPALIVGEPLVAAFCGSVIFDERLQVEGIGWLLIIGCVVVMIGTTFQLASPRSRAR